MLTSGSTQRCRPTLGAGTDVSWYERGFLSGQVAMTFIPVGGATKAKRAKSVLEGLADDVNWSRFTEEMAKTAGRSIDDILVPAVKQKVLGFGDDLAAKNKFLADYFDEAYDVFKKAVDGNPELVDSWKVLDEGGVDKLVGSNVDNLNAVSKYLDETGVSPQNFRSSLLEAGNKQGFIDELGFVAENGRRIPKTKGAWEGIPGESIWKFEKLEVNSITEGNGIPFKNGYPDFSDWSLDGFIIEGLTGNNTADFALVYKKMVDSPKYGFKTQQEVKSWLSDNGITLHHHQDGKTIQLIPTDLHGNIPHSGGAAILRNN
jgi:hypothetical protein